jgi:hypothetical protein
MARSKKAAIPTAGDTVKSSWLPAGYETDQPLAGAYWKPEPGDVKVIEVTGFQTREGENGEYQIWTFTDLQTGEQMSFVPGGLFDYLAREGKIVTGMKLGLRYKGKKELPNGQRANDWDINTLKK